MNVTQAWREQFPGAHAGTLLLEPVGNPATQPDLDRELSALASQLREQYAGYDRARLLALPTIQAYQRHYRSFGQTYHVLRQIESVALKGRPLTSPGGILVSAMFAAEVQNHLLTAGHDADAVVEPLLLDCAQPGDRFVGINGQDSVVSPGDMLMRDQHGILSAVLSGPDHRTRLLPTTTRALFAAYASAGIGPALLRTHLERIAQLVQLAQPGAHITQLTISP